MKNHAIRWAISFLFVGLLFTSPLAAAQKNDGGGCSFLVFLAKSISGLVPNFSNEDATWEKILTMLNEARAKLDKKTAECEKVYAELDEKTAECEDVNATCQTLAAKLTDKIEGMKNEAAKRRKLVAKWKALFAKLDEINITSKRKLTEMKKLKRPEIITYLKEELARLYEELAKLKEECAKLEENAKLDEETAKRYKEIANMKEGNAKLDEELAESIESLAKSKEEWREYDE